VNTSSWRLGPRWLTAGLLLGLALGLAYFFGFPPQPRTFTDPGTGGPDPGAVAVGLPAPPFALETTGGDEIQLESLRGSVVVLNFWATWCAPCELEMPHLEARYRQRSSDEWEILAVNYDEPSAQVAEFGRRLGLSFPLLLDPGGVVQALYRVRGYPTSMFVDRQGLIQIVHIGIMSSDQLDRYLEEMGISL
jgi:peroxiredoxin